MKSQTTNLTSDHPSEFELRDIAPGLWIWRVTHPRWRPGQGWDPIVASTCVESRGEVLLLDPLAPPIEAQPFWQRLDAHPPTAIVVLKPDHVRDVDLFARRYHSQAFGPRVFFREDIPQTNLQPIDPGTEPPAACWRSTTAVDAMKRRFGSPTTTLSSSPMR